MSASDTALDTTAPRGASTAPWEAGARWVGRYFLALLIGSYLLAAFVPGPGQWLGRAHLLDFPYDSPRHLTTPALLLAALLTLAGLEVRLADLRGLFRKPSALAVGLLLTLTFPVLLVAVAGQAARWWGGSGRFEPILAGLGLVAAMPVAGSATAWVRKAGGDQSLALGLVLASTLLSLVTAPLALYAVSLMAPGEEAARLGGVAFGGAGGFLAVCVVGPAVLGIAGRRLVGGAAVDALRPALKLAGCAVLLLLVYCNASASLPQALARPDAGQLVAIGGAAVGFCASSFAAGWLAGRLLGVGRPRRVALAFTMGMSNNGTAMVLASVALAGRAEVMLVLVCYNLVQHLVAGWVDHARPVLGLAPEQSAAGRRGSDVTNLPFAVVARRAEDQQKAA